MTAVRPSASSIESVMSWYASARRPLPWRAPGTTPWGVLVSEFMCQQTQVDRAAPRWQAWMDRWPVPSALAAAPVADAIRMWDRLGYPRRARWLHQAAGIIADEHGDEVPNDVEALLALPGVGTYTAAAVRAFAFGLSDAVLDTNVRRAIGRAFAGTGLPGPSITSAERALAASLVDNAGEAAARWSQAVMELGALICTAKSPACTACPIVDSCAWHGAGCPEPTTRPRRQAAFAGSDRQARGAIMAALRSAPSRTTDELQRAWPHDDAQRQRAIESLQADGLIEPTGCEWRLPAG